MLDEELVELIRENNDALGIVYKKCKSNTLRFLHKMSSGALNDYELEDIFQDGVLILYEKIIEGNFKLTCALQTYINSVCRYQLLNKLGKSKNLKDLPENTDNKDESMWHHKNIIDALDNIEDQEEDQFIAIEKALNTIREAGGRCYELLTQFWYQKKSIRELTVAFGYTNDVNTRNQKSKCQARLKVLSFNQLNGI